MMTDNTAKKTKVIFRPLSGDIESAHLGSMIKGRTTGKDDKTDYLQKVIVVVPESVTLAYEQTIMKEIQKEGFLTVTVMSPKVLMKNIFEYSGVGVTGKGEKISRITPEGTTIRLYEEIHKLSEKDQLSFFKKPFRITAVQRIYKCIDTLKMHGYTPEIIDLFTELPDITPLRKNKFKDISEIWHLYESQNKITEFDEQRFWKQMCSRVPYCDFLQDAHVMFYGFAYVYAQLLDFIIACCGTVSTIDFCIQAPIAVNGCFNGAIESIEHASEILTKLNIENKKDALCKSKYGQYSNESISYLADKIINAVTSQVAVPNMSNIEVYQASSQYNEILYAVQKIIEWHNNGYEWNQIAIACPDNSSINAILPQVLKTANIPYCYRNIRPLNLNGCAYFLENTVKCICNNYEQEDVIALMKCGYSPLTVDESMFLQNYAVENGITNNKWKNTFRYRNNIPHEITDTANNLRNKLIAPLEKLHSKLFGSTSINAADQMKVLFNYLIESNAYEKLKEENASYIEKGLKNEADFVRQSWEYIKNCLDTIATQSFKSSHISMQAMVAFIPMLLNGSSIKFIPQYADAVYIDNPCMLVPAKYKCTYIVGDQDKVLTPGDAILSSDDIKWLQKHDKLLKEKQVMPFWDVSDNTNPELVYQGYFKSLISATDKVCVSSSMVSHEGAELQHGALFTLAFNLLKEYKHDNIHGGSVNTEINPFCRKIAIELLSEKLREFYEFGTGVFDVSRNDAESISWKKLLYYFKSSNDDYFKAVCNKLNASVCVDNLDPDITKKIFTDDITSVTEIEKYASCPYKHFLEHGLHIKPLQKYSFEANLQGIFTHAALDLYMEAAMKEHDFPEFSKEKFKMVFNTAIQPLMDDMLSGPLSESVLDKMQAAELVQKARTVAEIITHWFTKTAFRPVGCEVVFSDAKDSKIPALNIKLDNGKIITLKGKIDRVDEFTSETGAVYQRCIDYKSSDQSLDLDAVDRGYQLQLMTYLLALKEADPSKKQAGVFYQHVFSPTVESESLDPEEVWNKAVKQVLMNGISIDDKAVIDATGDSVKKSSKKINTLDENKLNEILDGVKDSIKNHVKCIYDGKIDVSPVQVGKKNPCAYCEYKTICGFDLSIPGCCVRDIYGNKVQINEFMN